MEYINKHGGFSSDLWLHFARSWFKPELMFFFFLFLLFTKKKKNYQILISGPQNSSGSETVSKLQRVKNSVVPWCNGRDHTDIWHLQSLHLGKTDENEAEKREKRGRDRGFTGKDKRQFDYLSWSGLEEGWFKGT